MFRKMVLLGLVSVLALVGVFGFSKPTGDNSRLILDKDNTLILRGVVSEESVSKLIYEFEKHEDQDYVLYISSPGGDIFAGQHLVDAITAHRGKVVCYADVAISMAFVIFQSCPVRYVSPTSILMQHEASYGVKGNAPNNLSFVLFITDVLKAMDTRQADRLGMTYDAFKAKTRSDWWMEGATAVKNHAADYTAKVNCTEELTKSSYTEKVSVIFATVNLTWSGCPLVISPLKAGLDVSDKDRKDDAEEFYYQVLRDKTERVTTEEQVEQSMRELIRLR